jgi:hypothetical protein
MNRAFVRDFQKSPSLLIAQIADQHNLPLDLINQPPLGFTAETILGMDPSMHQSDSDLFQRPSFPTGVHAESDAGARTECCEKKFVWIWAGITATRLDWLVRLESMPFDPDILQKAGLF